MRYTRLTRVISGLTTVALLAGCGFSDLGTRVPAAFRTALTAVVAASAARA